MNKRKKEKQYTREGGLQQLEAFIPRVKEYGRTRNYIDAENTTVSQLSPWLNKGLLSEEEISDRILKIYSFKEVEKFLQEVYWRRYWRGYFRNHPHIWTSYREQLTQLEQDEGLRERVEKIETGDCSVEIMGYFSTQLVKTGYLHNHARMWFAAWWVHEEGLPWELGAHFFLKHLIDGDPAVNTLSWRWVAGLHTRGKHYLARRSNLEKYVSPALLSQYSGGLEKLEHPQPHPLMERTEQNIRTEKPLQNKEDYTGLSRLIAFPEDLNLSGTLKQVESLGAEITQIFLLSDAELIRELSSEKVTWNETALLTVIKDLEQKGYAVTRGLRSEFLAEHEPFIVCRPEVGYFSETFQEICQTYAGAQPYYDPEKDALNAYATAGFFSYWKKVKKRLF